MNNIVEVTACELAEHIGEVVRIHGSIYKVRKMSGFAFVILRTADSTVQCVYSEEEAEFPIDELKQEACVILTALIVAEERSKTGFELKLKQALILSEPMEEPPVVINNKIVDTSIENLLDYRPITLRNEKERAIFRIQAGLCAGFRRFFEREGFVEIHTPKLVSAGAEGGANIFKLDYFGKEAYLAQSPQFYKQMMVGVFERVYETGPIFRAEKHDTSRHLNEYTGVDFEMGYINSFRDIMNMETGMLKEAFNYIKENNRKEIELLKVNIPEIGTIPEMKFMEAKKLISERCGREIKDYEDFEPEEEKLLCEIIKKDTGSDFIFVTHYPTSKRPFYAMEDPENREYTLSFDLLFRGMEVTTGGQRIHTYNEQVQKMRDRGMDELHFADYLQIHKYGMPPHGGLGLGLERLTAKLLDFSNLRYATLFPRDINRITP